MNKLINKRKNHSVLKLNIEPKHRAKCLNVFKIIGSPNQETILLQLPGSIINVQYQC